MYLHDYVQMYTKPPIGNKYTKHIQKHNIWKLKLEPTKTHKKRSIKNPYIVKCSNSGRFSSQYVNKYQMYENFAFPHGIYGTGSSIKSFENGPSRPLWKWPRPLFLSDFCTGLRLWPGWEFPMIFLFNFGEGRVVFGFSHISMKFSRFLWKG